VTEPRSNSDTAIANHSGWFYSASTRLLAISLYFHSIVVLARIFPSGFIATAEVLIIFSVLLCFSWLLIQRSYLSKVPRYIILNPWIGWMLAWFLVMIISLSWSQSKNWTSWEAVVSIFEYRVLLLIPFIIVSIELLQIQLRHYLPIVAISAAVGVFSNLGELIFQEFWPGLLLSKGSHIIDASVSGLAILLAGFYAIRGGRYRYIYLLIFLGIALSVLLDEGKTGYVIVIMITACFLFFYPSHYRVHAVCIIFGALLILYSVNSFERSEHILQRFLQGVSQLYVNDGVSCADTESTLTRICFYFHGVRAVTDGPWLGYGVLDVAFHLDKIVDFPNNRVTDNLHNEFIQQFLILGVAAAPLIFFFYREIFFWIWSASENKEFKFLAVSFVLLILSGMAFNSTLKDFGEKNLYTVAIVSIFLLRRKWGAR